MLNDESSTPEEINYDDESNDKQTVIDPAEVVFWLKLSQSVISVTGCFGNLLIILIISKWKNITSGAAFMVTVAVTDFLAVFYNGIIDSAFPFLGLNLASLNDVICSFGNFFSWIFTSSSYYVTVLFSLDKCIATVVPFKYREHGKPVLSVISTLVVYFFWGLLSFPSVLIHKVDPVKLECQIMNFEIISQDFIVKIYAPVLFFLSGIIPTLSVIVLTTITIFRVRMSSARRKKAESQRQSRQTSASGRRDREMTRQMIIVGIVFSSLCLGHIGCVGVQASLGSSAKDKARRLVIRSVQNILTALTNSVNFFVYVAFGRKFREQAMSLLRLTRGDVSNAR